MRPHLTLCLHLVLIQPIPLGQPALTAHLPAADGLFPGLAPYLSQVSWALPTTHSPHPSPQCLPEAGAACSRREPNPRAPSTGPAPGRGSSPGGSPGVGGRRGARAPAPRSTPSSRCSPSGRAPRGPVPGRDAGAPGAGPPPQPRPPPTWEGGGDAPSPSPPGAFSAAHRLEAGESGRTRGGDTGAGSNQ